MEEPAGSVDALLCSFLMMLCMFAAYLTKKFHFIYLPESASALVLGVAFGGIAKLGFDAKSLRFSPLLFFYGLLPIIIFNAGYSLKKKDFFQNFTTIVLFAVVGTIASTLVYGLCTYFLVVIGLITHMTPGSPLLESLMFGSLISAIDPVATLSIFQDISVPPMLYNLVFGESLVNDAVAIVLFHTFESFLDKEFSVATIGIAILQFCVISVASIVLGFLVSLACALILKNIDKDKDYCNFELAFLLLSAYTAYAMADMLGLSGIMSLFFCGICNSHYGFYNMSEPAKTSSKYAFEALAFTAELFTFAYLGMQVVFLQHQVDAGLLLSAIPLCVLARAITIFPLSWLANKGRRVPISDPMKVMLWMCGLRGPIAYALCVNLPSKNQAIETTTLFIVVTTTLVFGILTAPVAKGMGLTSADNMHHYHYNDVTIEATGSSTPHGMFKWFDAAYLKPIFRGQDDICEPLNEFGASSSRGSLLSDEDSFKS